MREAQKMRIEKKSRRFTKAISLVLILTHTFCVTGLQAAPVRGESVAIIAPVSMDPQAEAAWNNAHDAVNSDPLLLIKDDESVNTVLSEWQSSSESVEDAREILIQALLASIRQRLDSAWDSYFGFDFKVSMRLLEEVMVDVSGLEDSSRGADALFETLLLLGMNALAQERNTYSDYFSRAAAIKPDEQLSDKRFSPEVISLFNRSSENLLTGIKATLSSVGDPLDADIFLDGQRIGKGSLEKAEVLPGMHMFEVRSAGYKSHVELLELNEWESVSIKFDLEPSGPVGDPGEFFTGRMLAGDRKMIPLLAERLAVDNVVLVGRLGSNLNAWLVDREGQVVSQKALLAEDEEGSPAAQIKNLLAPLRVDLMKTSIPESVPVNYSLPDLEKDAGALELSSGRKWLLVLGGVVLIALASGGAGGGSSTTVNISW